MERYYLRHSLKCTSVKRLKLCWEVTESTNSPYGYMNKGVGNGYELRDQSSTILFLPHGEKHAGPPRWIILSEVLQGNCKLMNWP